jgi:hypothetical protein
MKTGYLSSGFQSRGESSKGSDFTEFVDIFKRKNEILSKFESARISTPVYQENHANYVREISSAST